MGVGGGSSRGALPLGQWFRRLPVRSHNFPVSGAAPGRTALAKRGSFRRGSMVLALVLAGVIQAARDSEAPARLAAPRVVLVSGEEEYDSEASLSALAHLLAERHHMTTTLASSHSPGSITGLDALATADLAILFVRSRTWPEAEWRKLAAYLSRGGALVALRTSL